MVAFGAGLERIGAVREAIIIDAVRSPIGGFGGGCSGARIPATLLHEMKRRAPDEKRPFYGLAALCVGVGMGVSTLIEWIGD